MSWESLRDLIECPICFCAMVSVVDPRALPCLHTFCLQCLGKYANSLGKKGRQPRSLPCPFCRRESELPRSGPKGLPKSFMVCRIADALRHTDRTAPIGTLFGGRGGSCRERSRSGVESQNSKPPRQSPRPQPSAPVLPDLIQQHQKQQQQQQQQRPQRPQRPQPSAPALKDLTSGGACADAPTAGSPKVQRPVPMRQRSSNAASLPRPSSAPDMPRAASPIVDIPPRRRFAPLSFQNDDDDDLWGRSRNRKEKRSFVSILIGNFLTATR